MKIAFPTQENLGLESPVYGHFGSAPFFTIVHTDTGSVDAVSNADEHHAHGQCQPMQALGGSSVDAVVVGGIGAGALRKLTSQGVRVYRAVHGTVGENLALVQNGTLPQFLPDMTCAGHDKDGGCAHH